MHHQVCTVYCNYCNMTLIIDMISRQSHAFSFSLEIIISYCKNGMAQNHGIGNCTNCTNTHTISAAPEMQDYSQVLGAPKVSNLILSTPLVPFPDWERDYSALSSIPKHYTPLTSLHLAVGMGGQFNICAWVWS